MSAWIRQIGRTALVMMLGVSCPAAAEEIVWQIGTFDNSYAEFGIAKNHGQFTKAYAKGVTFVVGKSDAKKDWPFIHPGPNDHWAGAKPHAFVIEFDLPDAPKGECALRLDFIDTHSQLPSRLTIGINEARGAFALNPGAGDLALMDPAKGRQQVLNIPFGESLLRKGTNRITVTNEAGSWALYDALALVKGTTRKEGKTWFSAEPTSFFVNTDAGLQRLANIRIQGPAARKGGRLRITVDGKTVEHEITPIQIGDNEAELTFPPVEKASEATVELRAGSETLTTTMKIPPARKWKVYVAQSVHTDIGYTDLQKKVIDRHNVNTDLVMALCGKHAGYKWNLESSWAAQMYQRNRTPEQMKKLLELARQHRVAIEANYLNMLTGLCSAEELTRMLYLSADLAREYGIPFESVTLTDAPSHVWSIPTVLRRAGVKYLSMGINQTRAPLLRGNLDELSPVWWEGPDGSRVLSWFSNAYAWANRVGLGESVAAVRQRLGNHLKGYDRRSDYPYDAVLLHGGYGDNAAISSRVAEVAESWNRQYAYPKIVLANLADFFRYIEKDFADKIPTVRGCGGSYWEDGAASSAHETALNRNCHERVVAAESCWTALSWLGKTKTYPAGRIETIWDNILLYDEHTWGAHNSIHQPEIDFVTEQWRVKAAYATDADRDSKALLDEGLVQLAANVAGKGEGVLVYNPLSWDRTDVVCATLPIGTSLAGPDGKSVPLQALSVDVPTVTQEVCFLAKDTPAFGYRRYAIVDRSPGDVPPTADGPMVLENRFYRLTLDKKSGAIAGLLDKETGAQLVDSSSPYKLGEVLYATGGEKTQALHANRNLPPAKFEFFRPDGAAWQVAGQGPVFASARSTTKTKILPNVSLEVRLYNVVKRVDLTVHLDKKLTYKKEAVYVAFPFAAQEPKFRFEIGGAWVRPNDDHLAGACFDWFSVQNSVTLNTPKAGISWSAVDTPLITLCDVTTGRWLEKLPVTNGTIFAYAMNNYWFTNYKAGQDGSFAFRYSITSAKKMDTTGATHHGWGACRPLIAVAAEPAKTAALPAEGSFCRVSAPNVILSAFKRAQDAGGYVLRFQEVAGKKTSFDFTTPLLPPATKAWRCDSVERNLDPMKVTGGKVSTQIDGFGIETIRVSR